MSCRCCCFWCCFGCFWVCWLCWNGWRLPRCCCSCFGVILRAASALLVVSPSFFGGGEKELKWVLFSCGLGLFLLHSVAEWLFLRWFHRRAAAFGVRSFDFDEALVLCAVFFSLSRSSYTHSSFTGQQLIPRGGCRRDAKDEREQKSLVCRGWSGVACCFVAEGLSLQSLSIPSQWLFVDVHAFFREPHFLPGEARRLKKKCDEELRFLLKES